MRYANMEWSTEATRRRRQRHIDEETALVVVERGEVIEDSHRPGRELPTRIHFDYVDGRPLHVVVANADDDAFGKIVTLYEPSMDRWEPGFRVRRRQ